MIAPPCRTLWQAEKANVEDSDLSSSEAAEEKLALLEKQAREMLKRYTRYNRYSRYRRGRCSSVTPVTTVTLVTPVTPVTPVTGERDAQAQAVQRLEEPRARVNSGVNSGVLLVPRIGCFVRKHGARPGLLWSFHRLCLCPLCLCRLSFDEQRVGW